LILTTHDLSNIPSKKEAKLHQSTEKNKMKIKNKIVAVVLISCIIIFCALHAAASFIIMPSYKDIENQQTKQSVNQALTTLNYRLVELHEKVRDYAAWDDTYQFVQTHNPEYTEINLDTAFKNLRLNLIVVVDNNGNLVYCGSYDLNNAVLTVTSREATDYLAKVFWAFEELDQSKSGIISLDNQPVLVSISPVLTSSGEGPVMGGMLFGKYLDSPEMERISEIIGYNFSISNIDDFILQSENSQIADALNENPQAVLVQEKTPEIISGYMLVNDLEASPKFILQVNNTREVYQHGAFTRNIFIASSFILSLFFGIGVLFILQKQIIKPLTNLAANVNGSITSSNTKEANSKLATDEVSVLTKMIKDSVNQKLDTMNEVSRMVAHDLRNPLTGIKGAAYSLKKNYGQEIGEKGRDLLEVIDDCVEYSNKIVSDLWEYSSEIKLDKTRNSPYQLIKCALTTLEIPKNIQIVNYANDEQTLNVDAGKIKRVFSNLLKNAVDAMPNGGTLNITSQKLQREVEFDFKDSGVGMSEETVKKIGEPFFTTKAKGMGVGFSICKRIVEAHRGRIEVESAPGKGTKIAVFLPLSQ
jgi:signal transduction histidine kinase